MTSIDDLFKRPSLPAGSTKRKFEAPDAQAAYKATKLSSTSTPNGNHSNGATVGDGEDEDGDSIEAGPELPPDDDGDDEEGRFFGTGMTRDTAEALDYIDGQDGQEYPIELDKIDSAWLRRLTTSFEKKVKRNAELRARFEGEPAKFMDSEADLDAEIKIWSLMSEHPELYTEFAGSGACTRVVELLAHENTDIAIGAIEIISELLDEDVQAEQEQWDELVAALLDADLLELLMSNLARLDEENESDRAGVYHSLAVLENLASQQTVAEQIGQEKVLLWLCDRMSKPEKPVGQNKQYAAEALQVLLQTSPTLRKRLATGIDGVDLFLRLLSAYRKQDPPKDTQEEEFVENVFDALTCVVDEAEGKTKFVEAEGVELCLIMLKEGTKNISQRALCVLDHAAGGQGVAATLVCEKIIEAAGLKVIFGLFMKKADNIATEHLIGIFSALLRLLPGESAARIRLLAKFAEKDYAKVAKLVALRTDYSRRVQAIDTEIGSEQKGLSDDEVEERTDEWFSRRLDGGLFCLQTIDLVLSWLIAEDVAVRSKVTSLLSDNGGLARIRRSLEEQLEGASVSEDGDTQEMLETLVTFLS